MPDIITTRRDDRPTEGFTTTYLPSAPDRPVRLFLPADYQPKYAYPLLVVFHAEGGDADAAARMVPGLSRRNYIAACPRATVALDPGPTGRPAFGWDDSERTHNSLLETLAHVRREYHVHTERVYLVGVGEGASVAYRLRTGAGAGRCWHRGAERPHAAAGRTAAGAIEVGAQPARLHRAWDQQSGDAARHRPPGPPGPLRVRCRCPPHDLPGHAPHSPGHAPRREPLDHEARSPPSPNPWI